jgi:hypothetical protein
MADMAHLEGLARPDCGYCIRVLHAIFDAGRFRASTGWATLAHGLALGRSELVISQASQDDRGRL